MFGFGFGFGFGETPFIKVGEAPDVYSSVSRRIIAAVPVRDAPSWAPFRGAPAPVLVDVMVPEMDGGPRHEASEGVVDEAAVDRAPMEDVAPVYVDEAPEYVWEYSSPLTPLTIESIAPPPPLPVNASLPPPLLPPRAVGDLSPTQPLPFLPPLRASGVRIGPRVGEAPRRVIAGVSVPELGFAGDGAEVAEVAAAAAAAAVAPSALS